MGSSAAISRKMASQLSVTGSSVCIEINSFVRGLHAYLDFWQPTVGEVLALRRKPANDKDMACHCNHQE